MKQKWLAAAAIATLVVVPVVTQFARGGSGKAVEVENAQLRTITPSILASGVLTYESQVTLVSEVVGRITAIMVKEGDVVEKGQLLLRLDPESSLAEIAQLEATTRQSEINIERQQVNLASQAAKLVRYDALLKVGMVEAIKYDDFVTQKRLAEVELRASREGLKQSAAQLKQARERLAKTEIRAPIAGKVTSVLVKVGETAVPSAMSIAGSNLMVVGDTTSLYADINVDENDVGRIGVGQTAKVVPAAFPDKAFAGKVDQVGIVPKVSAGQSKIYSVKVRLDHQSDAAFRPGMSCRAEISTQRDSVDKSLAIPIQAVHYEEGDKKAEKSKPSVMVLEDGKAAKVAIEVGVADDAYIEVVRGLKAAQTVIVGPAKTLRFLRDGERVTATASAPKTEPAAPPTAPGATVGAISAGQ